jgi:uncharacterized protein (TIGR03437 family)
MLICACALLAQPTITDATNGASYLPNGGPGGGIAQGAIFVVKGRNLGPATLVQNSSFPIPIELAGTRLRVTVGATVVDAFMIYASAGQLAAILPSNTPPGTGTVTAIVSGANSAPFPVTIVRATVGLFTLNTAGSGPAVITDAEYNVITVASSAKPGQALIAWATGLGAAPFPDNQPAQAGDLPTQLEVFVGGKPAPILYRGRAPSCCAGLDQIVFQVPDGVQGCGVSLAMRVNGPTGIMSNFTTIAVANQGGVCPDPGGFQLTGTGGFTGTFSVGSISLSRTGFKLTAPGLGTIDSRTDAGSGAFTRFDLNQLVRSSQVAGTSVGNCTVLVGSGQSVPVDPIQPTVLDAGSVLNLTGPNGPKQLTKQQSGYYSAVLAQVQSGLPSLPPGTPPIPGLPGGGGPPYLEPGTYTVNNGGGGANVGSFTATMQLPAPLVWTNQDAITSVPRNMNLTVTWTGGAGNDQVFISGSSSQTTPRISASFVCTERASAGQFTVPSYVLSALPMSEVIQGAPTGSLNLSIVGGFNNTFTASGLDFGVFTYSAGTGKQVNYQ